MHPLGKAGGGHVKMNLFLRCTSEPSASLVVCDLNCCMLQGKKWRVGTK